MKSIKGTQTEKNLLKAFAGESQAKNRYEFFAKVADKEGYKQIAAIFLSTALEEQAHASRFFKYLEGGAVEITATYPAGKVGTTLENLEAAAMGEHEEWELIYPEFAKIAREEGFNEIAGAFANIAKIEMLHEKRYKKLWQNITDGTVFKKEKKSRWKCRKCGYVHESEEAPKACPACLHGQEYFELESENY